MSVWPSSKASKVLRALKGIGWADGPKPARGSHLQLIREGFAPFTWSFHDGEEIGPRMLAASQSAPASSLRIYNFSRKAA